MTSVACPEEDEQKHDHVVEECDKIEGKESSSQLKSQREFTNLLDDSAHSTAKFFFMKFQDGKKIEKELEWGTSDGTLLILGS